MRQLIQCCILASFLLTATGCYEDQDYKSYQALYGPKGVLTKQGLRDNSPFSRPSFEQFKEEMRAQELASSFENEVIQDKILEIVKDDLNSGLFFNELGAPIQSIVRAELAKHGVFGRNGRELVDKWMGLVNRYESFYFESMPQLSVEIEQCSKQQFEAVFAILLEEIEQFKELKNDSAKGTAEKLLQELVEAKAETEQDSSHADIVPVF